jgi:hypothetical protein
MGKILYCTRYVKVEPPVRRSLIVFTTKYAKNQPKPARVKKYADGGKVKDDDNWTRIRSGEGGKGYVITDGELEYESPTTKKSDWTRVKPRKKSND